jgi:methylmalonyl-CoA mutase N-terminal domain/subunit
MTTKMRKLLVRKDPPMPETAMPHAKEMSPQGIWPESRGAAKFESLSGLELKPFYTPEDVATLSYPQDLGHPGDYPYARGIHTDMYRTKLWTMRQFAGFGTARETNQRFRMLLAQGETGVACVFDLPTLMGYDSDHPRSFGEVGRCGVAVDSLQDVEEMFQGIRLDEISTSFAINGPAAILYCMYLALAEKQGIKLKDLRGTVQNDILKEYMIQNTYIFPPGPSLRLFADLLKFSTQKTPQFNTVSVSGYDVREAGATAVQELAFSMANAFTYVNEGVRAGLNIDEFVPRFSFFFAAHIDFFEEIAKFRAARRIWARWMREKYRARDPRAWKLRFHVRTAPSSLAKREQLENNVVRTTVEALAAVLGGAQSLHASALDEAAGLPSAFSSQLALRTQEVLAYESSVAQTADPLGGSYLVESLTDRIEEEVENYFKKIDEAGGVIRGVESGFFQKEITASAVREQKNLESQKRILVGVNRFQESSESVVFPVMKVLPAQEREQVAKLKLLRRSRSRTEVERSLKRLRQAAQGKVNLIPKLLDCVRAYATLGETVSALKEVFGEYEPPSVF